MVATQFTNSSDETRADRKRRQRTEKENTANEQAKRVPYTPYATSKNNPDYDGVKKLKSTDELTNEKYKQYQDRYRQTITSDQSTTQTQERDRQRQLQRAAQQQAQSQAAEAQNTYYQQAIARRRARQRTKQSFIAKKRHSLLSKSTLRATYFVNFSLFFPQLVFGLLLLASLTVIVVAESNAFTNFLLRALNGIGSVVDVNVEALFVVLLMLTIAIGWIKLAIIYLMLKLNGSNPIFGTNATLKVLLFLTSLIFYALPILNLIPISMLWVWYVGKHPT